MSPIGVTANLILNGVGFWQLAQKTIWIWTAIGLAIFFACTILLVYAQHRRLLKLESSSPYKNSGTEDKSDIPEKYKTIPIRDWLDIPAWFVHKKDVADAIAYDVVYGDAVIGVVKSEKDHRVITLTTDIFLEPKKTTLSQEEWERLDGQIASSLAQKDFQFSIPQPQHVQIIRQVYIPIDELQFRERIMDVFRARIPIIELWKEALRQSEKSTLDKEDSQTK